MQGSRAMTSNSASRAASGGLRKEEAIGLLLAIALHAAVLAVLLMRPARHEVVKPPQRIEVTISDEVGLTSTSPDPAAQAAPDRGPQPGEPAPEAAPVPEIEPAPAPMPAPRAIETPQPAPRPEPKSAQRPVAKPQPKAVQKPAPKPALKQAPKPAPSRKISAIDRIVSKPSPKSSSSSKNAAPPRKAGSSAFDDAFKQGTPGAKSPSGAGKPAATIGPQVRSGLSGAITRQLKPHWNPPEGADADQLVTILAFNLNTDGSLSGRPTVVRQLGITDANRAQAQRHAEQAIRAVQLASPFNLPPQYYDAWKRVSSFRFDLRLSQ